MEVAVLTVTAAQAAKMFGLSRAAWYRQLSAGRIGPMAISFGKSKRFSVRELMEWEAAGCPSRDVWLQRRGNRC
jgi:predicted DNA-binding transcriptional regulator AlpA